MPSKPGVYWFLDRNKQVLYVGKAKNLAHRLTAYKLKPALHPKTKAMLQETVYTRFTTTLNELTSLILEAQLVKTYQPPYNILLKDDKSPLYLGITRELYPKVKIFRKSHYSPQEYSWYLGPFTSASQTRRLLNLLRRLFPFCQAPKNQQGRPCFYYHLHLCPGACCGKISAPDYRRNINHLKNFLEGKHHLIERNLHRRINLLSRRQQFEQAAELQRQHHTLIYLTQSRASFAPSFDFPNLTDDVAEHRLLSLKKTLSPYLSLPDNYHFTRIEGYDVSNLGGQQATVSMVVFVNGIPSKSDYRRFKIKSLHTPNDPAMLHEALIRRFNHLEWGLPKLILIDGGRGQLNAAHRAVTHNLPLISLAKNPDRVFVKSLTLPTKFHSFKLNPQVPSTLLLQQVRDEAHRFAKNYHHYLHRQQYR